MLRSVINLLVFATLAAIALVGLFIAWWIAMFAVLAAVVVLAGYLTVRRFFGAKIGNDARNGGARVIEGEYQVQREAPPQRLDPADKP